MKNNQYRVLLLCFIFSLSACGGGGADIKSDVRAVSRGQELIDLQQAHNQGVISDEEFQRLRDKIVNE